MNLHIDTKCAHLRLKVRGGGGNPHKACHVKWPRAPRVNSLAYILYSDREFDEEIITFIVV